MDCWGQNSICHSSGAANIFLGDSIMIMGIYGLPGSYLARFRQIKHPSDFCPSFLHTMLSESKPLDWGGAVSTKWNLGFNKMQQASNCGTQQPMVSLCDSNSAPGNFILPACSGRTFQEPRLRTNLEIMGSLSILYIFFFQPSLVETTFDA